jgi:hypothetical protein
MIIPNVNLIVAIIFPTFHCSINFSMNFSIFPSYVPMFHRLRTVTVLHQMANMHGAGTEPVDGNEDNAPESARCPGYRKKFKKRSCATN